MLQYASAFHTNNFETWSHLKNKEDFEKIYSLENDKKFVLERIYGAGRDLAAFMSSEIPMFNYPEHYATLKSYVDDFDGGWLDEIGNFKLQLAKVQVAACQSPSSV